MDYMGNTVSVHKLGLNEITDQGAYYAKVNGKTVGDKDRAFWETESDAEACAKRFVLATENLK